MLVENHYIELILYLNQCTAGSLMKVSDQGEMKQMHDTWPFPSGEQTLDQS